MQKYTKFITAALAFAGVLVSSGLLDGDAQAWATAIVSGVGAALVYLLPNKDTAKVEAMPYESSN